MLLLTVVLWALNITVTKYILDNGFQPLAYAAVRYGARHAIFLVLTVRSSARCASAGARSLARWAIAAFVALPQPGVLRLRAQADDGDDGGADPRHDAGVRGALRLAGRARAHDRGGSGSPRASPFGGVGLVAAGSGGDFSGRPRGDPRRRRHRRHLGGLLGRDRAAHADVLAVPHQRGRADRSCACRSSLIASPQIADQELRPRLAGLARLRVRRRRAARAHERPLVHGRPSRRAGDGRRSSRTSSRSSRRVRRVLLSEPLSALAGRRRPAHRRRHSSSPAAARRSQRRRSKIARVSHDDFMPIEGWDHVELWVGNAKQSAYFYEHALGFTPVAYAGPETGVRDRASYVLEQGHIRLVVTSGLRADSEIARFAHAHGDGVKDVALTVPSATEAYRQAVQRGGVSVKEPHWVEDEHGRVELATIGTYGETVHTFVNRSECGGPVSARVRAARRQRRSRQGRRATCDRPRGRQRRARPHEPLGRVLREDDGHDGDDPLLRRGHLDGVLGAHVEGDDGRPREDQVPDQRAGRGAAEEPDRGVPRLLRRPGRPARRDADGGHLRDRRRAAPPRRSLPRHAGDVLRRGRVARGRDRRELGRRPRA